MVSWDDAVRAADNMVSADSEAAYQRAVAQIRELNPLVQEFAVAVKQAGKWPTDVEGTNIPDIRTRVGDVRKFGLPMMEVGELKTTTSVIGRFRIFCSNTTLMAIWRLDSAVSRCSTRSRIRSFLKYVGS